MNKKNALIEVPPRFVRNHPSQTQIMSPDHASKYLLEQVTKKTGIDLSKGRLLDVGCGTRFAVGIHNLGLPVGHYAGLDIDEKLIDWLRETITEPSFSFTYWPVRNPEYNPSGKSMRDMNGFPVSGLFDVITFFSVFTHLNPEDSKTMLEFAKASLSKTGRIFLTVFTSEDMEDYQEGHPERPSLVSQYGKKFFENMVMEAGLKIVSSHPAIKLAAPHYVLSSK